MSLLLLKRLKKVAMEYIRLKNVPNVVKSVKPGGWLMDYAWFVPKSRQKLWSIFPRLTFWMLEICEIFHNNDIKFNLMTAYRWLERNFSTQFWKRRTMNLLKTCLTKKISTMKVRNLNKDIPWSGKRLSRSFLQIQYQARHQTRFRCT
jgi:hypothetical protein